MKKKVFNVIFLFLTFLTLAACSATPSSSSKDSDSINRLSASTSFESSEECSSSEVLESTVQSSDSSNLSLMVEIAQSQIPSLKEQMGTDMVSDISIAEGADNTVIYTYTFAQDFGVSIDVEALKPVMAKVLKPVISGTKALVPDIKIQVIYLNPDLSEAANMIITQEDVAAIESDT